MSQFRTTELIVVISSHHNCFLKFFHYYNQCKIFDVLIFLPKLIHAAARFAKPAIADLLVKIFSLLRTA